MESPKMGGPTPEKESNFELDKQKSIEEIKQEVGMTGQLLDIRLVAQ